VNGSGRVIFQDTILIYMERLLIEPFPVVAGSKAKVHGRSLAGIAGSNPGKSMDVCLLRMVCVDK
jgi:hypothetical protein